MRAPPLWLQNSVILAAVVLPLVGTVAAVVLLWNRLVGWTDVALLVGMWTVSGMGITLGYHRMLTHRGFEAPDWVRGVTLAAGSMALQGPAREWAATHFVHHANSDKEGDPHSPLEGLFTAHLGWLFRNRFVREGPVFRAFDKDPVTNFVSRTFYAWAALGFAIPFAIGGLVGGWPGAWTGLLWGGLVRVFVGHHITWSVNSICHSFGTRPFATNDASRNNMVVALLGFGEGWHNNHHAFPQSVDHGLAWWQVDVTAWTIRVMEWLGLARNVKRAPRYRARARRARVPTEH
ncbi:MAG TPA: acyl-CoA desaturase [Candidatus Thermoplasmatota archaeon]|nr:acyl-CoA desaturase [Candidatus Thermoplasmatota archaeon]